MKIKYLLYGAILLLSVFSCIDDEGNYDYKNLEKLDFSEISDTIYLTLGEDYNIAGNIETNIPETNMEYLWYVLTTNSAGKPIFDTLGTDKDLTGVVKLSPGQWEMHYEILNTANNVRYDKRMDVFVETTFTKGWGVLSNNGGNAKLDFISEVQGLNIYSNILSSITGEVPSGSPVQLYFANGYKWSIISVITSEDGIVLDGNSMAKQWSIMDEFNSENYLNSPFTSAYLGNVAYEGLSTPFLVSNGKIYAKANVHKPGEGFWEAPVPGDYFVEDYYTSVFFKIILFDRLSRKYVYLNSSLINKLNDVVIADPESAAFNPANVNKDCLWMGLSTNVASITEDDSYSILKDDSGKYFLHQFNWGFFGFQTVLEFEFPDGVINENSCYAINRRFPYIYISEGSNIHRYNCKTAYLEQNWLSMESDIIKLETGKNGEVLAVALKDGSNSKLVLIDINDVNKSQIGSFSVEGEIVDVKYKFR